MFFYIPTMFACILVPIVLAASTAYAQEGEVIVDNSNKTQCISQMVGWCDGMKYPQQGVGMAMLSITYEDPSGYYRVFCSSDSDGTNCTRNGQPWFTCSNENKLTYNGKVLTANGPASDVDDDICKTADRAFNELFVQNLSYDNVTLKTELEKGMEGFFAQIAAMQEQIELIQKRLESIPLFSFDFFGGFGDGALFEITNDKSAPAEKTNVTTDQNNQIEKE